MWQLGYMVQRIEDLMEASRVNRGKVTLPVDRIKLTSVVESAVETSRQLITGGHELVIKRSGESLPLDAEASDLPE
jgi:hypothetical protein